MARNWVKNIPVILLCAVGVLIYAQTLRFPFHFDDNASILTNLSIRNLAQLKSIFEFWPTRFVTYLTISLNYRIGGFDVLGYHLFNLVVHLGCAILVWWLSLLTFSTPAMKNEKISQKPGLAAFFISLIFLTHPIQTQGVTYIIQRATSLAALFYLASLCFYAKFRTLRQSGSRRFYYIGSFISVILAMFTKEMSITLPFAILLYEFCFFNDKGKINYKFSCPFLITLAIIPLTMFFSKSVDFGGMHMVTQSGAGISPVHYFFTQARVMLTYLRMLLVPLNQNLDYDYPTYKSLLDLSVLASFIFLSAVIFISIKIFKKHRLISFGIFWFFLVLLPESSIIPIRDLIFEHRLYLAMAGFSIFLVTILYYLIGRKSSKVLVIVLFLIIAGYSILTYNRNFVWKDEFTLWKDVITKSPHKARPYYILGDAYQAKGDFEAAISLYNKAIQLDPQYFKPYNNRGNIYAALGNYALAIADYTKAIQLNPEFAEAYNNLGNMGLARGDLDGALKYFNKAIEIMPEYAQAYSNRGIIYQNQGKFELAIAEFSKAIQLDQALSYAYGNRAVAYFFLQEFSKSWEDVYKAESLGYAAPEDFLSELKKASGREK